MITYVAGLVFVVSLGFALAAPSQIKAIDDWAFQECNASDPVPRNPREVTAKGIASGERIKLTHHEKCVLLCFLQKVNFLDENADIRNVAGLVNHTLNQIPELAKYSDVLFSHIFQISRSMKEFYDKCQQAFVTYHQYGQAVFVLGMADGLQNVTGVKDKIVKSVENGHLVDRRLSQQVEQFLSIFDKEVKKLVN